MPLYEYECNACRHRFEKIQKFSDDPVKICPECGGRVRKLLSSPAIQFKGTGWYITDYARKPSGGQAAADAQKGDAKDSKTAEPSSKKDSTTKSDTSSKKSNDNSSAT